MLQKLYDLLEGKYNWSELIFPTFAGLVSGLVTLYICLTYIYPPIPGKELADENFLAKIKRECSQLPEEKPNYSKCIYGWNEWVKDNPNGAISNTLLVDNSEL